MRFLGCKIIRRFVSLFYDALGREKIIVRVECVCMCDDMETKIVI